MPLGKHCKRYMWRCYLHLWWPLTYSRAQMAWRQFFLKKKKHKVLMGKSQKYFDWFCSPDSLQGSGCIFFEILLIWGLDVTAYGNIQYLIKKNMIWFFEMQSCHLASCKSTSGFRVPRGASFLQITSACGRINLILFFHLYMQMTNIDQNDQKLAPRSLHRHTRLNRWSPPPTSPSWSIIKTFLAKLWSVSPLSEHRPWLKKSNYHRPAPKSWS